MESEKDEEVSEVPKIKEVHGYDTAYFKEE